MSAFPEQKKATTLCEAITRIDQLMRRLREQCPWDRKQTMQSIRHLTIEEVHELSEAILREAPHAIQEELGDLLLHVVFYTRMAEEKGWFTLVDVINRLCDKLIQRHPHIYGNLHAEDAETVKQNWERLKQKDPSRMHRRSIFDSLAWSMPSLIKAYRVQEKAAHYGFDWTSLQEVLEKVREELKEVEDSLSSSPSGRLEEEIGDLLFAVVNLARWLRVNPDDALEKAIRKFVHRFQQIEAYARQQGIPLEQMDAVTMNRLWEESKKEKKETAPFSR